MTWFSMTGTSRLSFGSIHIAASLAEVELYFLSFLNALNSQQSSALMLVSQTSLETSEDSLHVEPAWLLCLRHPHIWCLTHSGCLSKTKQYTQEKEI